MRENLMISYESSNGQEFIQYISTLSCIVLAWLSHRRGLAWLPMVTSDNLKLSGTCPKSRLCKRKRIFGDPASHPAGFVKKNSRSRLSGTAKWSL